MDVVELSATGKECFREWWPVVWQRILVTDQNDSAFPPELSQERGGRTSSVACTNYYNLLRRHGLLPFLAYERKSVRREEDLSRRYSTRCRYLVDTNYFVPVD
jgi:hypothetical protein